MSTTREKTEAKTGKIEESYTKQLERQCELYEEKISNLSDEITFLKKFVQFKGNSFCFTGALETMTRDKAYDMVRSVGGMPCSTMSHSVSYLVTNDKNSNTSKNQFAKRSGTTIIDEKEFLWIMEHMPKSSLRY